MPTFAEVVAAVVALCAAAGTFLGAWAASAKVRAESEKVRVEVEKMRAEQQVVAVEHAKTAVAVAAARTAAVSAAEQAAATAAQLQPNGGSSALDAINREFRNLGEAVARLEKHQESMWDGQGELRSDIRGLRRDVGRLHDQDMSDRARAEETHRAMMQFATDEHDLLRAQIDQMHSAGQRRQLGWGWGKKT